MSSFDWGSDSGKCLLTRDCTYRFLFWQRQLGLISDDGESWPTAWSSFYDTYAALMNITGLAGYLDDALTPSFMARIHIDVARLSRYFQSFSNIPDELTHHVRRMERILYIFSTSSSANGYSQGFHELLAPLYYVAMKGGCEFGLGPTDSEAVAYFMLHGLVNGTPVGEFFMYDDSGNGLNGICARSAMLLKKFDKAVADQMEANGVSVIVIAFSWITVLFAQVYQLAELLKLWDFLFTGVDRIDQTLACLVAAHLVNLREKLIGKDFAQMLSQFRGLELASEVDALRTSRRIERIRLV
jgi:hypothetical protein